MKQIYFLIILITSGLFAQAQMNVGSNQAPNSSAMLEISGNTKGVLIPRMSAANRTAIDSPATGLLVFQTDGISGFYYYNGIAWLAVSTGEPVNNSGVTTSYGTVTTLAGSIYQEFGRPVGVAADLQGNIYVADRDSNMIKKVTPAGVVTTFAGNRYGGFANGIGTVARFDAPSGVATDMQGNVYVADTYNNRIRKITPAGVVTTLAGSGNATYTDGAGTVASFNLPSGVAVDAQNNVYVADQSNHRIRKVTPAGMVTTLAGTGNAAFANGMGITASFNFPSGVAVDAQNNVYVADQSNQRIRKITQARVVTTLAGSGNQGYSDGAGTSASFLNPSGVATDLQNNVYVADLNNHCIRKITPEGIVTTLAGSAYSNYADGIGTSASFQYPSGVATDAEGNVYVAEQFRRIRKITTSRFGNYVSISSLSSSLLSYATASSLSNYISLTGVQSISGAKTFTANTVFDSSVGIGTITPGSQFEIRKDVPGNLGPVLQLTNGSGSNNAAAAVDFYTYKPTPLPGSRIYARDNNNFSSDIIFSTKVSGNTNNALAERMRIYADGGVNVSGSITATGFNQSSDIRFKQNIHPLQNSLPAVMQLQAVSWLWKVNEFKNKNFTKDKQIGFIAQDVEKIVPEVVATDSEGYKSIDYAKLTALLTEGMKAQQQEIESLKKDLAASKQQQIDLAAILKRLTQLEAVVHFRTSNADTTTEQAFK